MAAKCKPKEEEHLKPLKQPHTRNLCSTSLIVATISLSCFIYYIWTKSYQVILESQNSSKDGWWIIKPIISDKSQVVSFTEREFYLSLLKVIQDDIFMGCSFTYSMFTSDTHLDWVKVVLISLSTVIVIATSAYFIYIKNVSTETGSGKNGKKTSADTNGTRGKKAKKGAADKCDRMHAQDFALSRRSHRYYCRWLTGIMFFAFILSIPWEFVRLYQSMVAEKVTQITTGIPAECVPEQMSVTQSLTSWFRWQFSWSPDPCLQYHKALLVDPMWQVSPLMVITSAISHCLIYPVEVFFGGLGRAFRMFFREIPSPWQPVLLLVFLIFLFLLLIMVFGYRMRFPLLTFEPRTPRLDYLRSRFRRMDEKKTKKNLHFPDDSSFDQSITSSLESQICSTQESQDSQYS